MVPGERVASDGLHRACRHRAAGARCRRTRKRSGSRVETAGLEPATSGSPSRRAAICAASRRRRAAGRVGRIRTAGLLVPNEARCQAARRPAGWTAQPYRPRWRFGPLPIWVLGADRGARTPTPLRAHGPEPCASASSARSASAGGRRRPPGRWLILRRDGARRLACSHSVVLNEPVGGPRSYPRGDSNPQSHRDWAGGMCLFCYSGWWAAREGVEPPHRAVTGRRTAGCATWHRCSPAARSRQRNHEQTQRRMDLHGVRRPIHTS
jgi:hypothetical protein